MYKFYLLKNYILLKKINFNFVVFVVNWFSSYHDNYFLYVRKEVFLSTPESI